MRASLSSSSTAEMFTSLANRPETLSFQPSTTCPHTYTSYQFQVTHTPSHTRTHARAHTYVHKYHTSAGHSWAVFSHRRCCNYIARTASVYLERAVCRYWQHASQRLGRSHLLIRCPASKPKRCPAAKHPRKQSLRKSLKLLVHRHGARATGPNVCARMRGHNHQLSILGPVCAKQRVASKPSER